MQTGESFNFVFLAKKGGQIVSKKRIFERITFKIDGFMGVRYILDVLGVYYLSRNPAELEKLCSITANNTWDKCQDRTIDLVVLEMPGAEWRKTRLNPFIEKSESWDIIIAA